MQYLSTDLAIFKRLTGYPLDSQGRPVADADGIPTNRLIFGPPFQHRYQTDGRYPSWGIRIPLEKPGHRMLGNPTRNDPEAYRGVIDGFLPNSFRQVPVYDENAEGRKWRDVWPCVTFRQMGEDPQYDTYIYSDDFIYPTGDDVDIVNKYGEVIQSGKAQNSRRPHPDAYDLTYMIRTYSKSRIENMFLCNAIKTIFPQRSGLIIGQADGTNTVVEMFLKEIVSLDYGADELGKALTGEEESYYSRGFIYTVQGFFDNTVNAYGTNDIFSVTAITERILEIANLQDELQFSTNLNLDESNPI